MRYIWSPRSRVYHDSWSLGEQCNTDQLKDRREADTPPPLKRLCHFCRKRWLREETFKRLTPTGA